MCVLTLSLALVPGYNTTRASTDWPLAGTPCVFVVRSQPLQKVLFICNNVVDSTHVDDKEGFWRLSHGSCVCPPPPAAECEKNPGFMHSSCRKACGKCSPSAAQDAPVGGAKRVGGRKGAISL